MTLAEMTTEEAMEFLKKQREQRVQLCKELVRKAECETRCVLTPMPYITSDGRIVAEIIIRPEGL